MELLFELLELPEELPPRSEPNRPEVRAEVPDPPPRSPPRRLEPCEEEEDWLWLPRRSIV